MFPQATTIISELFFLICFFKAVEIACYFDSERKAMYGLQSLSQP